MIGKMVPAVGKIQSIYWYYKKGMIPTEKKIKIYNIL